MQKYTYTFSMQVLASCLYIWFIT